LALVLPKESIVDIYCHIFPDTFVQQMNQIAPRLGNIGTRLVTTGRGKVS
jgi:hypothetical protein